MGGRHEGRRERFIVASANPHKVAELRELLATAIPDLDLQPRPPGAPDVEETSDTLAGNALLKAEALVALTGFAAIADDTGLFVPALGGAPGVRTARYAGHAATPADNRSKLLHALEGLTLSERGAEFRTVVVLARPDGETLVAAGRVEGRIAEAERGDRGFGYDSVFIPLEGDGRTFAEMEEGEKHSLSHRGRAVRALAAMLLQ